jgi:hypothetical protein
MKNINNVINLMLFCSAFGSGNNSSYALKVQDCTHNHLVYVGSQEIRSQKVAEVYNCEDCGSSVFKKLNYDKRR